MDQFPADKTVTCTSDLWNVTCVLDPAVENYKNFSGDITKLWESFKIKLSENRLRFESHPGFIFKSKKKKVNVQVELIYTILENNPPRLNNVLFVYDEETISSENRHKTLTKYYLR